MLTLSEPAPLNVQEVLINIALAAALSMLLGWHYKRFGTTFSNRAKLAWILPAVSHKSLPIVIIRYLREYFVSADRTARLTIDSAVSTFDQTRSGRPNLRGVTPAQPALIVELKGDASSRKSLQAAAAHIPLGRVAWSKYSLGVLAALGQAQLAAGALGRVTATAKEAPRELRLAA